MKSARHSPLIIRHFPPSCPPKLTSPPIWKKQKLFVALFLLAVAGWFFWDGFVGYPHSNERWLAHEELVKSGHETEWPAVAREHGWTEEVPHKFFQPIDLRTQWICGTFATLLGLVSLAYWLTQKGRVLRTDGEAVYSPAGTRIPFGSITGLGKKKWEDKGLATVLYKIEGRKGRFLLDDYKFERDATHAILAEIEAKLLSRPKG
ncbi:MAG: hypothetical protein WDN28_18905 [Chthoniobacter sp.]